MVCFSRNALNPGVWGWPQGALLTQRRNNGNRKFTIFAILLLPRIKTVADSDQLSRFRLHRIIWCQTGIISYPGSDCEPIKEGFMTTNRFEAPKDVLRFADVVSP